MNPWVLHMAADSTRGLLVGPLVEGPRWPGDALIRRFLFVGFDPPETSDCVDGQTNHRPEGLVFADHRGSSAQGANLALNKGGPPHIMGDRADFSALGSLTGPHWRRKHPFDKDRRRRIPIPLGVVSERGRNVRL